MKLGAAETCRPVLRKPVGNRQQRDDVLTADSNESNESCQAATWCAKVITLLPEAFPGTLGQSLSGRALAHGIWELETIDLRRFGIGRHRSVDDTPVGGGAGMVMRADVLGPALRFAMDERRCQSGRWPVLCMSPRGEPLTQQSVRELAGMDGVTILCGRFEGIDERILQAFRIREVSIGDFVLSGGEIAAQALIDAAVRLIPLVLGNQASVNEESFSGGLLEYPQYTRPRIWEGLPVPEKLLSGHHEEIASWRLSQSRKLTRHRRPDLWRAYCRKLGVDPENWPGD